MTLTPPTTAGLPRRCSAAADILVDGEVIRSEPAGQLILRVASAIIVPSCSDSAHMVNPQVPAWHAAHVTGFAVRRRAGGPWSW